MKKEKKAIEPDKKQPQKANETSFKQGDKAAEKWTFEISKSFFEQAYELSFNCNTLTSLAHLLEVYPSTFDYVIKKFPILEHIKKDILENIAEKLTQDAFTAERPNTALTIFLLKVRHGLNEKTENINTNVNYNTELTANEIKLINDTLENEF